LWTHKLIFFFRFYKYKNKNHKFRNNMMYHGLSILSHWLRIYC
jgi:hypothetical protein